jgi:spore coat polysaccharide biosynthesis protein SpsF
MGSTRLPGKSMMDLCGKTVLSRVIDRVKRAANIDSVCVATTTQRRDDVLAREAEKNGVMVFRGPEDDVMLRFCGAAEMFGAGLIIRVTADNPFTEPSFIDKCAEKVLSGGFDYATMEGVPYGSNAEAVRTSALVARYPQASEYEKEHVTPAFYEEGAVFRSIRIKPEKYEARPDIRLTLDTPEDYKRLNDILAHFKGREASGIKLVEVIEYVDSVSTRVAGKI